MNNRPLFATHNDPRLPRGVWRLSRGELRQSQQHAPVVWHRVGMGERPSPGVGARFDANGQMGPTMHRRRGPTRALCPVRLPQRWTEAQCSVIR
jgi:hypothetical protein